MRQTCIALTALLLAVASALAQPPPPQQPVPPPLPTPLPPVTNIFPPLMPPVAGGLLPRAGEGPPFRTPPLTPMPSGAAFFTPFVFGYPSPDIGAPRTKPPRRRPVVLTGVLRLSVIPEDALVFVDSYYVGTVGDVNAQRLELEAGPHRIEIRAPERRTLTFDVRIVAGETLVYRGVLETTPVERPPAPPRAAAPPTPMYLIPKCYLGNIPPRESRLPAGCDIKQVQILGSKQ